MAEGTASCRCGAVWGGLRTAHCAAEGCHKTFSGPSNFDEHRPGECRDPADCGMVVLRISGNSEIWGHPSADEWWKVRGDADDNVR